MRNFTQRGARQLLSSNSLLLFFFSIIMVFVKLYLIKWISFQRSKMENTPLHSTFRRLASDRFFSPFFSIDEWLGYLGQDYPHSWIPHLSHVQLLIDSEANRHYNLSGDDAEREWDALIPNNGIIYLGEAKLPYSLSMFHQLRCLSILRTSLAKNSIPSVLDRHCLNYLRQMMLCQSDLTLEMEVSIPDKDITSLDRRICKDWSEVYRKTKENQFKIMDRNGRK